MHTPPWEPLGAVQCGDMLRYLGILLGAETCCATVGYSWERWHGTRTFECTCTRHLGNSWGLCSAETCCATLGHSWERWHGTGMHAHTPPWELQGLCSGGDMPRHLGILLGALADRSRDTPGGTGCPQQRCEYTGRLHMQGDTRTRCLGNSWVRCGELRKRRWDDGLLERPAQSEHASACKTSSGREGRAWGSTTLYMNKGPGVSCWTARLLVHPPPLDGSFAV